MKNGRYSKAVAMVTAAHNPAVKGTVALINAADELDRTEMYVIRDAELQMTRFERVIAGIKAGHAVEDPAGWSSSRDISERIAMRRAQVTAFEALAEVVLSDEDLKRLGAAVAGKAVAS